jgi:methyl coenzyme M reductase subunit C-like uncharacterized protein (methanogenesis marker protein 7)
LLLGLERVALRGLQRGEDVRNISEVTKKTDVIKEFQDGRKNRVARRPDCRLPKSIQRQTSRDLLFKKATCEICDFVTGLKGLRFARQKHKNE